jgi:hypothetical protein
MMETMIDHPCRDLIEPLSARDRCDVCGAQAYIGVLMTLDNDAPLLFCGHHGSKNLPAILARDPLAVRDETDRLKN